MRLLLAILLSFSFCTSFAKSGSLLECTNYESKKVSIPYDFENRKNNADQDYSDISDFCTADRSWVTDEHFYLNRDLKSLDAKLGKKDLIILCYSYSLGGATFLYAYYEKDGSTLGSNIGYTYEDEDQLTITGEANCSRVD